MYCYQCGEKLIEGARFCHHCGADQSKAMEAMELSLHGAHGAPKKSKGQDQTVEQTRIFRSSQHPPQGDEAGRDQSLQDYVRKIDREVQKNVKQKEDTMDLDRRVIEEELKKSSSQKVQGVEEKAPPKKSFKSLWHDFINEEDNPYSVFGAWANEAEAQEELPSPEEMDATLAEDEETTETREPLEAKAVPSPQSPLKFLSNLRQKFTKAGGPTDEEALIQPRDGYEMAPEVAPSVEKAQMAPEVDDSLEREQIQPRDGYDVAPEVAPSVEEAQMAPEDDDSLKREQIQPRDAHGALEVAPSVEEAQMTPEELPLAEDALTEEALTEDEPQREDRAQRGFSLSFLKLPFLKREAAPEHAEHTEKLEAVKEESPAPEFQAVEAPGPEVAPAPRELEAPGPVEVTPEDSRAREKAPLQEAQGEQPAAPAPPLEESEETQLPEEKVAQPFGLNWSIAYEGLRNTLRAHSPVVPILLLLLGGFFYGYPIFAILREVSVPSLLALFVKLTISLFMVFYSNYIARRNSFQFLGSKTLAMDGLVLWTVNGLVAFALYFPIPDHFNIGRNLLGALTPNVIATFILYILMPFLAYLQVQNRVQSRRRVEFMAWFSILYIIIDLLSKLFWVMVTFVTSSLM
ncbi:MAG: hypothetical protein Q4E76_02370 [Tissierellia bacterium]|nr:hypothetical protein [Tissierellia bacterium]